MIISAQRRDKHGYIFMRSLKTTRLDWSAETWEHLQQPYEAKRLKYWIYTYSINTPTYMNIHATRGQQSKKRPFKMCDILSFYVDGKLVLIYESIILLTKLFVIRGDLWNDLVAPSPPQCWSVNLQNKNVSLNHIYSSLASWGLAHSWYFTDCY